MSSSDEEDPWTVFLREELIRVRTRAQNRMSSTIAPSSSASNVMGDPETPTVQTDFESDHDHETVIVTNKTKLKRPNTPETIQESPQSSPTHSSPPAPSHIIIDRPGTAQRSGFLSCINQNKGIIIIAVLIYLFAATGFGRIYFYSHILLFFSDIAYIFCADITSLYTLSSHVSSS